MDELHFSKFRVKIDMLLIELESELGPHPKYKMNVEDKDDPLAQAKYIRAILNFIETGKELIKAGSNVDYWTNYPKNYLQKNTEN